MIGCHCVGWYPLSAPSASNSTNSLGKLRAVGFCHVNLILHGLKTFRRCVEGEDRVKENSVTIPGLALSKDTFSLGCATAFFTRAFARNVVCKVADVMHRKTGLSDFVWTLAVCVTLEWLWFLLIQIGRICRISTHNIGWRHLIVTLDHGVKPPLTHSLTHTWQQYGVEAKYNRNRIRRR